VIDLIEMKALVWRDESLGASGTSLTSRPTSPTRPKSMREDDRDRRRAGRRGNGAYLEGEMPDNDDPRLIRKGTSRRAVLPGVLRLGLQEQGRAAAARRRDRLPAEPARRSGHRGHQAEDRSEDHAQASDDEPLRASPSRS
jgi:elongation factor G